MYFSKRNKWKNSLPSLCNIFLSCPKLLANTWILTCLTSFMADKWHLEKLKIHLFAHTHTHMSNGYIPYTYVHAWTTLWVYGNYGNLWNVELYFYVFLNIYLPSLSVLLVKCQKRESVQQQWHLCCFLLMEKSKIYFVNVKSSSWRTNGKWTCKHIYIYSYTEGHLSTDNSFACIYIYTKHILHMHT